MRAKPIMSINQSYKKQDQANERPAPIDASRRLVAKSLRADSIETGWMIGPCGLAEIIGAVNKGIGA